MRFPTLALIAFAVTSLHAVDEAPAKAEQASVTPPSTQTPVKEPIPELTPEQQKQAFFLQGFILASRSEWAGVVNELDLNESELNSLLDGMRAALKREKPSFDAKEIIPGAEKLFNERIAAKSKRLGAKNDEFLAKIDADKSVTKTASGLRYKIVTPGTDPKPTATSLVKCLYTGKLVDGTVFDSTSTRGNEPTEFPLNGVIPAWTEGVQLIGKGGKILIYAPANLAYGEQGQGPIPGNSVLEFEVELVEFK
jgi:FKBP-type peptidyl-prolyl cis-trans isomerase